MRQLLSCSRQAWRQVLAVQTIPP